MESEVTYQSNLIPGEYPLTALLSLTAVTGEVFNGTPIGLYGV